MLDFFNTALDGAVFRPPSTLLALWLLVPGDVLTRLVGFFAVTTRGCAISASRREFGAIVFRIGGPFRGA